MFHSDINRTLQYCNSLSPRVPQWSLLLARFFVRYLYNPWAPWACLCTRRCIAEYYSMGRTRGIVLKVLVDCSWNQSRNTWKYENVVPVVFGNLGALRILPGVERDGFAHSPHSISFPLYQYPGPANKDIYIPSSSHCVLQ